MASLTARRSGSARVIEEHETIAVRFAGDSGDGMQLAGTQFTNASAIFGNDICTFPDFPAEIRAPAGTLAGVSGFQVNFSSVDIHTPGDQIQALIAMNPAALKTNVADLDSKGILIVNADAFTQANLTKAGYESNPLEDGTLDGYRLFKIPIDALNREAVAESGLSGRAVGRCKNFFALGMVCWLYDRPLEPTLMWIGEKFARIPAVAEANKRTLRAGYDYCDTVEMFTTSYRVPKAKIAPGRYRKLTGNEAIAMGLIAAAQQAGSPLFYASYPITPASDILHELSRRRNFGVKTFQAEDEIAAMSAVIGAAFCGALAATGTSGPGLDLKGEAIGLAVMTELPLVIVNVQRGGPSTGLPTKTEQSDLLHAIYGRHGECPLVVLAPATSADCFTMAFEAIRLAVRYMTPVILLTDGYLANGAEPWRIPNVADLPKIQIHRAKPNGAFQPYARDDHLARPWAVPGTPGMEHRIGGLEKEDLTGDVCYDPRNHERMTRLRAQKIAGVTRDIPPLVVDGPASGDLLVVGWGSTYGAIISAIQRCRSKGLTVSNVHIRHMNPLPADLGDILGRFDRVLVPELNTGHLRMRLRAEYLVDAVGLNKIQGKPFMISEIEQCITELLGS
ncbi:MAG: 2-oxoacid:acceptor oxidoreductase subunit alpha [Planctomycetes bacterium]|nr:2-oxoacid:acceptor oxidoreductase subunit alpha [Planctomycetota bacterium]